MNELEKFYKKSFLTANIPVRKSGASYPIKSFK